MELNKKISLSQVNLKDFLFNYIQQICPYKYTYFLENNLKIVLSFEENQFSHLLGLHKFNKIKSYNHANDINNDINCGNLTLKLLKKNEPRTFTKELKDRMTSFPLLKTLLVNADSVLKYNLNVIWHSKINFSFLLYSSNITIVIYLAIKKINDNTKFCVPISFFVDRTDKFSNLGLEKLKIISTNITSK